MATLQNRIYSVFSRIHELEFRRIRDDTRKELNKNNSTKTQKADPKSFQKSDSPKSFNFKEGNGNESNIDQDFENDEESDISEDLGQCDDSCGYSQCNS